MGFTILIYWQSGTRATINNRTTALEQAVVLLIFVAIVVCGGCVFGLSVLSSFAIILMRNRELYALLKLSSWCIVTVSVLLLFLGVSAVGEQCVNVIFSDHTHFFVGDIFSL